LARGIIALALVVAMHIHAEPPNIVLIMADDVGIEGLGCYGGESYKTPHLDQLAATGMRYTHAYSTPLCTPTRLSIMTGKYNHRNWQYFGILPKTEKTFGHLMTGLGYRTLLVGKWQLTSYDPPDFPNAAKRRGTGTHPKDAGFHEYHLFHAEHTEDKGSRYANPTYMQNGVLETKNGEYGEDINVDVLLNFMKRNKDEKIFAYYPMALPHGPFVPTPNSTTWKDPARRLDVSTDYFKDMVEYIDTLIGRIVGGLTELGLRENTAIIFYSDNGTHKKITARLNGEEVKGGKGAPTQTGVRVPLIVNWPAQVKASVTDQLVDPSDFLPTLAELAGGKLSEDWRSDGVSFAPGILGKGAPVRSWSFCWYDPRPGWDKDQFSRHIFALDHSRKLFSDGRLYDVEGLGMKEDLILPADYSAADRAAKAKLQAVIDRMMAGAMSKYAKTEVDGFGNPVKK
jgi:arylsulfatase A-like enzyme